MLVQSRYINLKFPTEFVSNFVRADVGMALSEFELGHATICKVTNLLVSMDNISRLINGVMKKNMIGYVPIAFMFFFITPYMCFESLEPCFFISISYIPIAYCILLKY